VATVQVDRPERRKFQTPITKVTAVDRTAMAIEVNRRYHLGLRNASGAETPDALRGSPIAVTF
jgi:hypothetical protein